MYYKNKKMLQGSDSETVKMLCMYFFFSQKDYKINCNFGYSKNSDRFKDFLFDVCL